MVIMVECLFIMIVFCRVRSVSYYDGHADIVKLLLEHKANPDIVNKVNTRNTSQHTIVIG